MTGSPAIPFVSVSCEGTGASTRPNELGMRPMQERAWERRGEQYLLIKSPPASGKSRALMFIALDKLRNQGLKQAIVAVPERTIGASFADARLTEAGFWADWTVRPRWNLCNAPGRDNGGKVNALKAFLDSGDNALVCTHATFRFAMERFGADAFDGRLIAVDEFHHVSAGSDNRLGEHVSRLLVRDKAHVVAMTGSYFRGDAEPVLTPEDEARFETVTYTYCEQLNGYEHLKQLDIGYYFYAGNYVDSIVEVLKPQEKTIVHIPSVNARESTKDKIREVEHILEELGEWQGTDPATGFQQVRTADGRVLRVADLVDDDPAKRDRVVAALRDPERANDRDHVDVIIALGMAKEGFDWIWCEHALTVGYRSSLTEVVQIIGRATRDAPGKARARFTNLVAEPQAPEGTVTEAVNDTLKAIAASLLMEQVLAPRFRFTAGTADEPSDGGDSGASTSGESVRDKVDGDDRKTGEVHVEVRGLAEPTTKEAERICQEDLKEVIAKFLQDKEIVERGVFDEMGMAEELTVAGMGKIVKGMYPNLGEEDREAVRQRAVAALNLLRMARKPGEDEGGERGGSDPLVEGIRKFAMDVRNLDIDMIDRINPFQDAYAILAKTMDEGNLKQIAAVISAKRRRLSPDEARELARRARAFKQERGCLPSASSSDPWERRMAEGVAFLRSMKARSLDEQAVH